MKRSSLTHFVFLGMIALVGLFLGSVLASPPRGAPHAHDSMTLRPLPYTLEEQIDGADLIVIGTVGAIVHEDSFLGYDAHGGLIKAADMEVSPEAEIPFFDYEVRVDEVLKSDGTIRPGTTVTMRAFNKASDRLSAESQALLDFPPSMPGERRLFIFRRNTDGQTYGLHHGPGSRLIIDSGPYLKQSDGAQTLFAYDRPLTLSDFTAAVAARTTR